MTLGDGFDNREEAQRTTSHIGGIVRLNPDGSAPSDNPFIADANALPALYSIGHRNVQGLVFDDANQRLIAHEHGPRGGDELNDHPRRQLRLAYCHWGTRLHRRSGIPV